MYMYCCYKNLNFVKSSLVLLFNLRANNYWPNGKGIVLILALKINIEDRRLLL